MPYYHITIFILSLLRPSLFVVAFSFCSLPNTHSKRVNMQPAEDLNTQSKSNCVPCESLDTSSLLTADKLQEGVSKLALWDLNEEDNKISRNFTAKNFQSALDAINDIGVIAEREGHHPDLHLTSYRDVTITLYTHSVGGLTENDLTLAKIIDDEVKVSYSPKWLKKHADAQFTAK